MQLPRSGVELYTLTLTTTPAAGPEEWQASFDDEQTWHACAVDPANPDRSRWLLAGPSVDPVPTGAIQVSGTVTPKVRLESDPEIIIRNSPEVTIVS